jgi:hypothetical protein
LEKLWVRLLCDDCTVLSRMTCLASKLASGHFKIATDDRVNAESIALVFKLFGSEV